MKINNQINFTVINKQANSLYSLIADGQYRSTSLGRNKWLSLIGSNASLQCVKRKGSTQSVPGVVVPKQESVFSATIKQIAMNVTPGWGLGAEGTTMKQIHVEIWITTKEKHWASRQWGISWCSENNAPLHIFERVVGICYTQSFQRKLIVTMMSRSKLSYRQTLYT